MLRDILAVRVRQRIADILVIIPFLVLQLAIANREHNSDHHGPSNRRYSNQHAEQGRRAKTGLLAGVPLELRQAALNLIDYQLTPVLVDQWRCVASPK